jgi:hypothetical protein
MKTVKVQSCLFLWSLAAKGRENRLNVPMTSCLAVLLLLGYTAQGAGPLPKFTFQGVALHPKDLSFDPTGELERASLIKMEGRIPNPVGKFYLYYSPHKHVGIGFAYSDNIEGPWTEYKGNPVITDAAIPDIRWIPETGRFHLWAHRKNSQTEMWTSADGLHFEYYSISITAKNIGTRNATYTRVYEYPLERFASKYIMLYSGFLEERGIRCIWLAHSKDGAGWTQVKTPLVEPVEGEGNDIYGPSLLPWQGRNFLVYQDSNAYRGGNVKYVELDRQLNLVGDKGERYLLIDPVADSPIDNRYRECELYREGDTLCMYASGSERPRIIVYATAAVDDANTAPNERAGNDARPASDPAPPDKKNAPNRRRARTKNVNSPSRKEKSAAPRDSVSLDDILTGVELETVYETIFDQPPRVIREDELIADGKIAREPPHDIDWVLEGPAELQVKARRLHIRNDPGANCVLWNTGELLASSTTKTGQPV